MFNNYKEVVENAREKFAGTCNVCAECNGSACRGKVPGCGAKGSGAAFTVCREYLKSIKINMDVIHEHFEADTKTELFGKEFNAPFYASPIGGMQLNYKGIISEEEYVRSEIEGCLETGILPWTGDAPSEDIFNTPLEIIKEKGGMVIPTIKPWEQKKCFDRIKAIEDAHAIGFAMDVDSAALVNFKLAGKPVFTKSERDLKELTERTELPLVVKGVMTAESAMRCADAGCYGIVISSHGGRVMEDAPATASVIREIRKAVGNNLKLFVDGGIRSGSDVFKCLALGADAVGIGRPYVTAVFGGGAEGVKLYNQKITDELKEIMLMTNCRTIKDITADKIII